MLSSKCEILIIGAGMAGITCALELHRLGKNVVIIEKSRGVGGRMATRRLFETIADHGTCSLKFDDSGLERSADAAWQALGQKLISAKVVKAWTDTVHSLDLENNLVPESGDCLHYIAPAGMSSIAKYLASDLDIRFNQKVTRIEPLGDGWQVEIEGDTKELMFAKTIISTIPAPQALNLLIPIESSLSAGLIDSLRAIEFDPCVAVIGGYTSTQFSEWSKHYPAVYAITCPGDPQLGWLGVDSSKRDEVAPPVFVLQSTAEFARLYLGQSNSQPAASALLSHAGIRFLPWLADPQWQHTQVWRYAFAKNPLKVRYLQHEGPSRLILTGDWCGGRKVEHAMLAGAAVAELFV